MKKVLFTAAVAAAGLAFGIESANTVGYLNNDSTVAGLNMVGPGFVDVGLTSTKLTGLKVTNASGGEVGTGACSISLIDELGNATKVYLWKSSGRGANKTWGWKDGDDAVTDSVVFARGVGLLFSAETLGDTIRSAGEVNLSAVTNSETVAGLNVIANPFPMTIKLNTLKVTNAAGGEVGTGACSISLIDELGNATKVYLWKSSGRGANKTWDWKDGDDVVTDTVTLTPGQAVLFSAETAGDKLIIPAQE